MTTTRTQKISEDAQSSETSKAPLPAGRRIHFLISSNNNTGSKVFYVLISAIEKAALRSSLELHICSQPRTFLILIFVENPSSNLKLQCSDMLGLSLLAILIYR